MSGSVSTPISGSVLIPKVYGTERLLIGLLIAILIVLIVIDIITAIAKSKSNTKTTTQPAKIKF